MRAYRFCQKESGRYKLPLFLPESSKRKAMKHLPIAVALGAALLTSACTSLSGWLPAPRTEAPAEKPRPAAPADGIAVHDEQGDAIVQKVEFRSGMSSATVERLAKRFGCNSDKGAGLVTEKGPVEVYRMQCDNGTTFLAQCELRQCRPLR